MRNYAESKGITLDNKELYKQGESQHGYKSKKRNARTNH